MRGKGRRGGQRVVFPHPYKLNLPTTTFLNLTLSDETFFEGFLEKTHHPTQPARGRQHVSACT